LKAIEAKGINGNRTVRLVFTFYVHAIANSYVRLAIERTEAILKLMTTIDVDSYPHSQTCRLALKGYAYYCHARILLNQYESSSE
jgi:hypothetical protein